MTAEVNMDTFLHAPPHKIRVQSPNPNRQMTQTMGHQSNNQLTRFVNGNKTHLPPMDGRMPLLNSLGPNSVQKFDMPTGRRLISNAPTINNHLKLPTLIPDASTQQLVIA